MRKLVLIKNMTEIYICGIPYYDLNEERPLDFMYRSGDKGLYVKCLCSAPWTEHGITGCLSKRCKKKRKCDCKHYKPKLR